MLPYQIAVILADRVGRRQCIVRKFVILGYRPHQLGCRFPVGQLFSEECMEYRSGGIESLDFILHVERIENICRISHRKMGAVGIIRRFSRFTCRNNVRVTLSVMLRQTVGG